VVDIQDSIVYVECSICNCVVFLPVSWLMASVEYRYDESKRKPLFPTTQVTQQCIPVCVCMCVCRCTIRVTLMVFIIISR
jgi:hypothetical protein